MEAGNRVTNKATLRRKVYRNPLWEGFHVNGTYRHIHTNEIRHGRNIPDLILGDEPFAPGELVGRVIDGDCLQNPDEELRFAVEWYDKEGFVVSSNCLRHSPWYLRSELRLEG